MTPPYRTLLVEDNPTDALVLAAYAERVPFLTIVGRLDNALDALTFLCEQTVDLLVVDIQMPQLSGLELIKSLPQPPAIILTTHSLTDSLEAYDLGVADYLVKPFGLARFLRAVHRALPANSGAGTAPPPAPIYLKSGRDTVQILLTNIRRIEALGAFCRVFLPNKELTVTHTIGDLSARLLAQTEWPFIRIHRSHIVPVQRISRLAGKSVYLGDERLPLGDAYREQVRQCLTETGLSA